MIEQRGHATPALLATTPIPLTQGKYALVDSELAHIVSGHKWHYNGGYAIHSKYISITVHKAMIMHRHLWEVVNGLIPERTEIDHINGDRLDNRLKNLRVVTDRQQASNRRARREGKTSSKYPGVCWESRRKKWRVQINVNGRKIHIGYFDNEEEAYAAYQSEVSSR